MLDVNDNLDDSSNYGTVGDDASRARYGIVFLEIPSPAGLNRLHVHKSNLCCQSPVPLKNRSKSDIDSGRLRGEYFLLYVKDWRMRSVQSSTDALGAESILYPVSEAE